MAADHHAAQKFDATTNAAVANAFDYFSRCQLAQNRGIANADAELSKNRPGS
jgi:hypothetical protein